MARQAFILIAALALMSAHAGLSQGLSRPVTTVEVPLDGTALALRSVAAGVSARLRVTGIFTCSIDGKTYDACFRTDASGEFSEPHDLLVVRPDGSSPEERDLEKHSYLFRPPPGSEREPTSFTVALDVNKLVREFIRPPSEVRSSLSGDLKVTLLVAPPPHAIPVAGAMLVIPVLLVAVFLGLMVHGKRRAGALAFSDVTDLRGRIREKSERATDEIGSGEGLLSELGRRVQELREGAEEVAKHVVLFRRTRALCDVEGVKRQIEAMERRAEAAVGEPLRRRYEQEIAGKRQTLEFLQANEDREAEYLLRLAGVETALDNLLLKLPELRVALSDTDSDEIAVDEVDRELELLHKTVAETREQLPAGTAAGIL